MVGLKAVGVRKFVGHAALASAPGSSLLERILKPALASEKAVY